jgi:hypothetical protein
MLGRLAIGVRDYEATRPSSAGGGKEFGALAVDRDEPRAICSVAEPDYV